MKTQKQNCQRILAASQKDLHALVVELCEQHFRQFPYDRFALIYYAMAKIDLSQYSHAEKALCRTISLCKEDGRVLQIAFKEMGNLFDAKGDLKAAAVWHRRALRVDPKSGNSHIYLGHVAFRRGLLKQAESHYRKATNIPGGCVDEAYYNLGGVLVAKRRYREAIQCYRKAIKLGYKFGVPNKRLKDTKLALQLKNS